MHSKSKNEQTKREEENKINRQIISNAIVELLANFSSINMVKLQ